MQRSLSSLGRHKLDAEKPALARVDGNAPYACGVYAPGWYHPSVALRRAAQQTVTPQTTPAL
ncbi:MAG: hypothetical protein ABSD75_24050 [Terriglobales bacterium]